MNTLQQAKINKAETDRDTSDALRLAITGLKEIQELASHPNSDTRIRDWSEVTLVRMADALPDIVSVIKKPTCSMLKCDRVKLVFKKPGENFQTKRGGFLVIHVPGWVCPNCGGSYGGTLEYYA